MEDLDFGEGGVHVRFRPHNENLARAKSGYGRDRFVNLPTAVMSMLDLYITEVWIEAYPEKEYLWIVLKKDAKGREGNATYGAPLTISAVEKMFQHYSRKSGVIIHPHLLRHWLVTRSVRDIYETSKNAEEIERRLRGLVEYMKWKSEETLTAYQHYFDEQRDADTREAFHERMHGEIQHYLEECQRGRRQKLVSRKPRAQETEAVKRPAPHIPDEPDLAFLYRLAGEV